MSTLPTDVGGAKIDVILQGDNRVVLRDYPDAFFDCCVTSPPYWKQREYSTTSEIGQERTKDKYILSLLATFDIIKKKLKPSGSLWVNIGEKFDGGHCLAIPEDFDYMMRRTRGWTRIQNVIWYKPDGMAESATRRFTQKFEPFYWYVKSVKDYYFDPEAAKIPVKITSVQRMEHTFNENKGTEHSRMAGMVGDQSDKIEQYLEKGVNCGDCWPISTNKEKVKHIAPYPRGLVARPILSTCPVGGIVCDPFVGSGTTCLVAHSLNMSYVGVELNPDAVQEAQDRIAAESVQLLLQI